MPTAFDHPPSVELLKSLTPGSLKQNLAKALRLWVILRSIYGDEADQRLQQDEFSYNQWRNQFFTQGEKHHQRDRIPSLHDRDCRCAKTLQEWLFGLMSITKDNWCHSFQQYYPIQINELEVLLSTGMLASPVETVKESKRGKNVSRRKPLADGRLFAVTGKNLEYDFSTLVEMGYLKQSQEQTGKTFKKVSKFPDVANFQQNLREIELVNILNPDLATTLNTFSQPIAGIQRFSMHVEYIVSQEAIDRIEVLEDHLKKLWAQNPVPPVKIEYDSANIWRKVDRIVYPVYIYYYQRALYLCAYGQTPKDRNQVTWYNYRLDRIQKLQELTWSDTAVPESLRQHYQQGIPHPTYIQNAIAEAWGFDFYLPSSQMLLRFEQDFHDKYIQDTFRHETFTRINLLAVEQIIKKSAPSQQELLLKVFQRHPDDCYYTAKYRVTDNNVVMRLRAWGPKVEVLLPWDLRLRMIEDLQETGNLYK